MVVRGWFGEWGVKGGGSGDGVGLGWWRWGSGKGQVQLPSCRRAPCCPACAGSAPGGQGRLRTGTLHPAEALRWPPRTGTCGWASPETNTAPMGGSVLISIYISVHTTAKGFELQSKSWNKHSTHGGSVLISIYIFVHTTAKGFELQSKSRNKHSTHVGICAYLHLHHCPSAAMGFQIQTTQVLKETLHPHEYLHLCSSLSTFLFTHNSQGLSVAHKASPETNTAPMEVSMLISKCITVHGQPWAFSYRQTPHPETNTTPMGVSVLVSVYISAQTQPMAFSYRQSKSWKHSRHRDVHALPRSMLVSVSITVQAQPSAFWYRQSNLFTHSWRPSKPPPPPPNRQTDRWRDS